MRPTVKRAMCSLSRGMSYAEAAASMPPPGNSTPPGSSMSAVNPWSSHSSTSSPAKCCKPPLSTAGSKSGIRGTVEHSRPTRHFFRTGAGIGAGGAGAHAIPGVASPSNVVRGDAACAGMLIFETSKDSASAEDSKYSAGGGADAKTDAILGVASPWSPNVAGSTVKKMPLKQPRGPRGVNSNPGLNMLKQAHARMHARTHARTPVEHSRHTRHSSRTGAGIGAGGAGAHPILRCAPTRTRTQTHIHILTHGCRVTRIICYLLSVTCHLSPVTCHL